LKINIIRRLIAQIVFLGYLLLSASANAGLIFESAEYPQSGQTPNLGGLGLDDTYFVMHRFYLDSTYSLESIGGYFWADRGRNIFGAVVQLSNEDDFPNSYDLTTSDVLGTTLISIGSHDGDYLGSISLMLDTGWYAVAFGTGAFGADSANPVGDGIGMPDLEVDLSNDLPITSVSKNDPWGGVPRFVYQSSTTRFIVNGNQSVEVPEPKTLYIIFIGIALISLSRKRSSL